MLSNTATPKYYGAFRERVLSGELPVCREISMQMNRIDQKIANPALYYDDCAIEGFIAFCEVELTLSDGADLTLLESFKLWSEDLLSWFYFVERSVYVPTEGNHGGRYVRKRIKKRLTKKQYIITARGSAKSMYLSMIHSYFLSVDTSTTDQVTTAPTMAQAEEVTMPMKTAIVRARGPLYAFLTEGSINNTTGSKAKRVKLTATKKGIENFMNGSICRIRPMSIDKLQGLKCKIATVDEWLSGDVREDVVGALEQGAGKNSDYIIVAVSSEGTVRNGPGDTIKMELMSILKGELHADHVSIWHYKLDDIKEVNDPAMWVKANPNLGQTIDYDAYQMDVERMTAVPEVRNDILAKRFGIPCEGYTYFFTYEETKPHKRNRTYWQMPCSLGADLSMGDDFCAFTFLFPLSRGEYGIKTRSYISSRTMVRLQPAMRMKYETFIEEGTLIVLDGTTLDLMEVYEDLERHIEDQQYDVRCLGYDPYNAKEFVDRWIQYNGPYGVEKVIQGSRTESVPLGELKDLAEDRLLLFDEDLMSFAMGNCIVLTDTNGNRKLYKMRADEKIDNVAALMDAYVVYKLHKDDFE